MGLGRSRHQAVWIKAFNQDSLRTGLTTRWELQKLCGTAVKFRSVGPVGTGSNPSSVTYSSVCTAASTKAIQLCLTLCDPRTIAHQAPLSMGFSRQEYWGGLPFPSPGDLPNLGIEPRSSALQADSLTSEPPGKLKRPLLKDHHSHSSPPLRVLKSFQTNSTTFKG